MGDNDAEVDCVNLWQLHGVERVSDSRIATTRIDKTDETTQRRIDEWQNQQLYKLELQSVKSVCLSVCQSLRQSVIETPWPVVSHDASLTN